MTPTPVLPFSKKPSLGRVKSCTWKSPFTLFSGGLYSGGGLMFGGKFVLVIRGAYIWGRGLIFGISRYDVIFFTKILNFQLLIFLFDFFFHFWNFGHQNFLRIDFFRPFCKLKIYSFRNQFSSPRPPSRLMKYWSWVNFLSKTRSTI